MNGSEALWVRLSLITLHETVIVVVVVVATSTRNWEILA